MKCKRNSRGVDVQGQDAARVTLLSRDLVSEPHALAQIFAQHGPFVAVVHCIGMLLPNSLNALASGSGSVPARGVHMVRCQCFWHEDH